MRKKMQSDERKKYIYITKKNTKFLTLSVYSTVCMYVAAGAAPLYISKIDQPILFCSIQSIGKPEDLIRFV